MSNLGGSWELNSFEPIRCLVSARAMNSRLCRILRDRGSISRRSKSASFGLTLLHLNQARPLGGLHRTAPVPLLASYFTFSLHPLKATPRRFIARLYGPRAFSSIPFFRFVAHRRGEL